MKKQAKRNSSSTSNLKTVAAVKRPPVVVLLGHVDHGKTTLLSSLKNIDLTKKEHGGISQHTRVYKVVGPQKAVITFIDTPGHEAFTQMRSRGAKVADLALLIIAANEGIKPQTKESLAYIKKAKLPFFVVINKIDLEGAKPEMVKSQLAKEGVLVEGLGGDIVALAVSAKAKKGLDELLEMILLFAELEEIKGNPQASLEAVVIESSLDWQKGPLITLLVKKGLIKLGQEIFGDKTKTRVRAIFDDQEKRINQIGPGEAGVILGFNKNLEVGSLIAENQKGKKALEKKTIKTTAISGEIKIILKADVLGTLEALEENLPEKVVVVNKGGGSINESDVLNAATTGAAIVSFNPPPSKSVKELARTEKVQIVSFQVIYELLDWLEKKLKEKKGVKVEEKETGEAEIIAEFNIDNLKIAGCKVLSGKIEENDKVRLWRKGKSLGKTRIKSLKHKRKTVQKAVAGKEYGLTFASSLDFRKGDMIISYSEKTGENFN